LIRVIRVIRGSVLLVEKRMKDSIDAHILQRAKTLRAGDKPPANLAAWKTRRAELRKSIIRAMGEEAQDKTVKLSPKIVDTLKRKDYRIENILFQSRQDVWVTANAYIPEGKKGKLPAVLVVHGHWAGARRDPVVQARCLGLVKLGFFVLAVDAFGAGERHPTIKKGSYHGALLGSTLWPSGKTLLGMQVHDNARAVDYMLSRDEVDKDRLGITGASGGGNQTMYAGALDERFKAVVPVCSVGTYQSYLKAACCVCEVLPGALSFTEEGDVLGLVAPRALMVINATQDAHQFSVGESKKSLERAKAIFKLHDKEERCVHVTFESPHAYNKPMRESMYGWMTKHLKGEGKGEPIAEPDHQVEKEEDLACYPGGKRPEGFVFPSTYAAKEARKLIKFVEDPSPNHKEAWEAKAGNMLFALGQALGRMPGEMKDSKGTFGDRSKDGEYRTVKLTVTVNEQISLPVSIRTKGAVFGKVPPAIVLHLDGKDEALKHPLVKELLERNWAVYAPDLRATGELKPDRDGIADAPDHNSAEHALWIGEPLLGQWVVDVRAICSFIAKQPGLLKQRLSVIGLGQAGLIALCAVGASEPKSDLPVSVALIDSPVTLVTETAYPAQTRIGLLAPGLLKAGDIPHLAALAAPRTLVIAGGIDSAGKALDQKGLEKAYSFTSKVYSVLKKGDALTLKSEIKADAVAAKL
jgi:dienelactone hydrolase